jgi:hypothetical protein
MPCLRPWRCAGRSRGSRGTRRTPAGRQTTALPHMAALAGWLPACVPPEAVPGAQRAAHRQRQHLHERALHLGMRHPRALKVRRQRLGAATACSGRREGGISMQRHPARLLVSRMRPQPPHPAHRRVEQRRDLAVHGRRLLGEARHHAGALLVDERLVVDTLLEGSGVGGGRVDKMRARAQAGECLGAARPCDLGVAKPPPAHPAAGFPPAPISCPPPPPVPAPA